jgi:FkbH-like protein
MQNIKASISSEDFEHAFTLITEKIAQTTDLNELLTLAKHLKKIPVEVSTARGFISKKIAVLAGYTSQFVTDLTSVLLLRRKIRASFWESDYGLYEQVILTKDADLITFKPDLIYFFTGTEHLRDSSREVERWLALTKQAHELTGAAVVLNTFEEPIHRSLGNFEFKTAESATRRVQNINRNLAEGAPQFLHFHDVNALASFYGRKNWRDEKLYDLSKIPVATAHLISYAENLTGVFASIFGASKKVLVLDLDNTLWGGVIGDDGVGGIEIGEGSPSGEAYKRFQTYIRSLKDRGIVLAVCSKNDEANAKEPFVQRDEMVLKLNDISCFVANWEPKHINIQKIAQRLNLGLDSFVFVDDNPAEREIVRQNLPEVEIIDMPEDPAEYTMALSSTRYFETTGLTAEDLERTEQYRSNSQREELQEKIGDYSAFLKSLEMRAVIAPFDATHLPRITQLINKTNQFNLTTQRFTDAEVKSLADSSSHITRYIKLKDRFGDNGLISILIAKIEERALVIDSWLMSCRVLKRGVEQAVFLDLLKSARALQEKYAFTRLSGRYIPTKKNKMVEELLPSFGFVPDNTQTAGETCYHYDLGDRDATDRAISELEAQIFIQTVSPEGY